MKHAATRALFDYWDRLRGGRAAPERSDVDPGSIRTLLGDVFLLELGGKDRHVVRLAGTRICALLGREWKGRPFAEPFAAEDWPDLYALLESVTESTQPVVAGIAGETADGRTLELELLLLPLRHRGRTHARLLGSLVSGDWPYWAGVIPISKFRLVSVRHLHGAPAANDDSDLTNSRIHPGYGHLRIVPGGRA